MWLKGYSARMRVTLSVVLLLFLCSANTLFAGRFNWFNAESNRLTYADGGTYLAGDQSSWLTGCYVQLISAGMDATNNAASVRVDGATGDDAVVADTWVGGNILGGPDGRVDGGTYTNAIPGAVYFVRIWSAPSPDFSSNAVPGTTNLYGDSPLWTFPGGGVPPDPPVDWDFAGNGFGTDSFPLYGTADDDGDGMPNWWEQQYFNTVTGALPLADTDSDGWGNAQEYVADTHPSNSLSFYVNTITNITGNITQQLYLAEGTTNSRVYAIQWRADMQSAWTSLHNQVRGDDGGAGVTFTVTNQAGGGWYRSVIRVPQE